MQWFQTTVTIRYDRRPHRCGYGEAEARRLIEAGLAYFGWKSADLRMLMEGGEQKLALAALVRERTSVTNGWLAVALNSGHTSRVNHAMRRANRLELAAKLRNALLR